MPPPGIAAREPSHSSGDDKNSKKTSWSWAIVGIAALVVVVVYSGGPARIGSWLVASDKRVFWFAAIIVVAFLTLFEAAARAAYGGFFATVILGKDKRTSTSKTFVLMWTLLVAWALVALLIAGEFTTHLACVTDENHPCVQGLGLLQMGWEKFLGSGLDNSYLVLLGIPAAAAVGAKTITQSKVEAGSMPVVPTTDDDKKLTARVAQIFSADDGDTDVGDLQYVIFNLLTAAYFVSRMVRQSGAGLPTLPETLLGLTGVSAALYVGKKAATRSQPTITAVFPSVIAQGTEKIVITGTGLTGEPSKDGNPLPRVSVNGLKCSPVTIVGSDRLEATLPKPLNDKPDAISGTVDVVSALGFQTPPYSVTVNGK